MINLDTMQELLVSMSWVVPVLIAFTAVVRMTFTIPDRYMPMTSLLVGIAAGGLFVGVDTLGLSVGIILGLSASGLYDFGKKTVLNI